MSRLALALALASGGCAGQQGTLTVSIVVPQNNDPFVNASQVKITLGDPPIGTVTAGVSAGHFDAQIQIQPASGTVETGAVEVDALDSTGNLVGRGKSPLLSLTPADGSIAVFVGRPGTFGVAPASESTGRLGQAIAAVPRLGALIAGGTLTGQAVTDTSVYDVYTHQLLSGAPLPAARTATTAIGFDRSDFGSGAAALIGAGAPATPSPELDEFDPLAGTGGGGWAALATSASLAHASPQATLLGDGSWLITGDALAPTKDASIVVVPPTVSVTAIASGTAAARSGHTATAIVGPQGAGALLFGGVTGTDPAAEMFVAATRSFAAQDLMQPTRTGHTATALADGRVVIAGGTDAGGTVHGDGFVVSPQTLAVSPLPQTMTSPRTHHAAALVDGKLVLCGGSDGTALVASCDVYDGMTLAALPPIPLAVGRTDAALIALDSGALLLVGGATTGSAPLTTLEMYTP